MDIEHVDWAEQFVRASDANLLEFCRGQLHDGDVQANAAKVTRIVTDYLMGARTKFQKNWQQKLLGSRLVARTLVMRDSHLDKPEFDMAVAHAIDAGGLEEQKVKREGSDKEVKVLSLPL
jgi:hypothetical protein